MKRTGEHQPLPDRAHIVYDDCLGEIDPSEFTAAWYGIFRTSFYRQNAGQIQDPNAIAIVPHWSLERDLAADQEDSGFGIQILLNGRYWDGRPGLFTSVAFDLKETANGGSMGTITFKDTDCPHTVELNEDMTLHFLYINEAYEAADNDSRIINPSGT